MSMHAGAMREVAKVGGSCSKTDFYCQINPKLAMLATHAQLWCNISYDECSISHC